MLARIFPGKVLIVYNLRPEIRSNPKKIPGSKVKVPLESPKYAGSHTRSLTMRPLGVLSCTRSNTGGSEQNLMPKRRLYLTSPPFF